MNPIDSIFISWNRVHWTWFLFGPPHVLQIALKKLSKQHSQSLSFPPTLTLIPSRSLSLLIPPCSVALSLRLSVSLRHRPSPSPSFLLRLSISFPLLPSRSIVVTPPFHHRRHCRPKNHCLLAMISIPTTAGYHSHLISSMWFLGFYIIVWMIVWIVFVF